MQLPELTEIGTTKENLEQFLGVNQNERISDGEWCDMTNCTCDNYPVASSRKKRGLQRINRDTNIGDNLIAKKKPLGALYSDGNYYDLRAVENNIGKQVGAVLFCNNEQITSDIQMYEPTSTHREIVRYGNDVCIFPDGVVYADSKEQKIATQVELKGGNSNRFVQFRTYVENSTKTGYKTITFVDEATKKSSTPDAEKYNSKSYRVQDGELQQWITTNNMWASVTPYTLITYAKKDKDYNDVSGDLFGDIEEGDTIDIVIDGNSEKEAVWFDISNPDTIYATKDGQQGFIELDDEGQYNTVSCKVIKKSRYSNGKGRQYIVVQGLTYCVLNSNGNQEPVVMHRGATIMTRKCPDIMYACESQNRVWGCSKDGHEIYASALGDPFNFYDFSGISTDSYAVNVGTDGLFTGCTNYLGTPIFFKENAVHIISGSYPEQYTVTTYTDFNGVKSGSENSIAIINNVVYYHSAIGIVAFDGTTTSLISNALQNDLYCNATAGAYKNKYYISMQNKNDGKYYLFVYDTTLGVWTVEDNIAVSDFIKANGVLLLSTDDKVYSVENVNVFGESTSESDFDWEMVTGVYGYSYPNNKYLSRFQLRMWLGKNSRASVYIQYDSDGTWHRKGEMFSPCTRSYYFPIVPQRCDHMKIKIAGKGEFKLFSITKCLEEGGEI